MKRLYFRQFNYNKTFYRDGNLEPNRVFLLIKIIPFMIGVPNVI